MSIKLLAVFWSLITIFFLVTVEIFILRIGLLIFILGLVPLSLSIWLIILTLRSGVSRNLGRLLTLTGASGAGISISLILHNLVFELLIMLFGEGFWERVGIKDEPVFFLLALFVLAIAFIVGAVGSVVLMRREKPNSPSQHKQQALL